MTRLLCVAALGWLAGCANRTVPAASEGAVRPTGDPVVRDDSGKNGGRNRGLDADTARREAGAILDGVAAARNLEVTRTVDVDVIDREGIRKFAKASMYESTTPQELQMLGRIESSLGVMPVGTDPETVLLDLLEDGVLGLYDPKSKTLFIGDFVPKPMLSMVVGHEIAHGLQDMHFDLEKLQKPMPHQADRESALRFLIEGEAQAAYLSWVSGEDGLAGIGESVLDAMGDQTLELAGEMTQYPVLARSLQMPYADGTATIVRLVNAKGWEAVDALYEDLPQTSEQMLHLDKLLAREPARPVQIDTAALETVLGLKRIWHDELGEASLLSMLAEVEPAFVARKAAAGWGGDHLLAFDDPDAPLAAPAVVVAVAWDSEADAKEFAASFEKYASDVVSEGTFVRRQRDLVVIGARVPQGVSTDAVATAALSATTVGKGAKAGDRKKASGRGGGATP